MRRWRLEAAQEHLREEQQRKAALVRQEQNAEELQLQPVLQHPVISREPEACALHACPGTENQAVAAFLQVPADAVVKVGQAQGLVWVSNAEASVGWCLLGGMWWTVP